MAGLFNNGYQFISESFWKYEAVIPTTKQMAMPTKIAILLRIIQFFLFKHAKTMIGLLPRTFYFPYRINKGLCRIMVTTQPNQISVIFTCFDYGDQFPFRAAIEAEMLAILASASASFLRSPSTTAAGALETNLSLLSFFSTEALKP